MAVQRFVETKVVADYFFKGGVVIALNYSAFLVHVNSSFLFEVQVFKHQILVLYPLGWNYCNSAKNLKLR